MSRARMLTLVFVVAAAGVAHADSPRPAPAPAAPAPVATPWAQAGVDWTQVPPLGAETPFVPPRPTRLTLSNGMRVLVVENHRLPLVSMELVVADAGSAQDPPGKAGVAAYTADLLDEGAGGLGPLAIAARVDELGASLELSAQRDAALVSMSTLSRTLDASLELLAKVVTQPALDAKEATRVHDDRETALELRRDQPRQLVSLILRAVIYGAESAYGRPADGTLADLGRITLADAKAFYAARWTPRAMTLVIVGDVDAATVKTRLETAFGAWKPAGKPAAKVRAPAAKPGSRLWLVDRPGAEQADVRVGIYGLSLRDPRLPAADVLAKILGGSFTSRLNHRLREELGWTYGANAQLTSSALVGQFIVSTALVSAHAVEGVNEILTILDGIVAADVPDAELEKARANVVREQPQRFATNGDTAEALAWLVENGLPDDYFATYVARIQKVSAKDVRQLARTLLPSRKLVVVVAGDAQVVRAGLEKRLGPATLVKPDLLPAVPAPR